MYKEIFDIHNESIVINEHILNIPVLRAIKDFYTDPMPAFKFLRYRYDPKSPYCDEIEEQKDEILLREYPGEYTLEDPVMLAAVSWIQERYVTPTYRYYLDCKILMEKLGKYGRDTPIESSRDGNLSALQRQMSTVGKTITEFKQLEKVVEQEIEELSKSKNRGQYQTGFGED